MGANNLFTVCAVLLMFVLTINGLDAFLVTNANYALLNQQILDVSGGEITELRLNISVPVGSRVVLASHEYTYVNDSLKPHLYIYSKSPKTPFNFSSSMTVNARAIYTQSLPQSYEIPFEYISYLSATKEIPFNNLSLGEIAVNATTGYSSDFEKISALAYWVHKYIGYNLSYVGKNLTVYQILEQKQGVCGDYSLLYATLARSLGYPTRFVNGYAYSSVQDEWVGHAWNEVYIGKWVPVDATWLEVGNLDATHVAVSKIDENVYSLASVSAMVYPSSAKLFWQGVDDSSSRSANNLLVENMETSQPSSDYSLEISHSVADANSSFIVYLKYPSNDYRILRAYLSPCTSDFGSILEFENKELWTSTKSNQDSYLVWEGKVNEKIDKAVRYKCPLTLNSDYLERTIVNIDVEDFDYTPDQINVTLQSPSVGVGQSQSIIVQSGGKSKTVYLLMETGLEQKFFDSEGFASFEFSPQTPGKKRAYAWSETSSVARVDYDVGSGFEQKIFDMSFKPSYMEGDESEVTVILSLDQFEKYKNSTLFWKWGNQSALLNLSNISSNEIRVPFTPQTHGNYLFSVSLFDSNSTLLYSQSRSVFVREKSFVNIHLIRYTRLSQNVSIVRMILNYSGPIESMWILAGNKKYQIPSNQVQLDLIPNSYDAKIFWLDSYGTQHELPFFIQAPSEYDAVELTPGLLVQKQSVAIASIFGPVLASVLIILFLVYLKRRHDCVSRF